MIYNNTILNITIVSGFIKYMILEKILQKKTYEYHQKVCAMLQKNIQQEWNILELKN